MNETNELVTHSSSKQINRNWLLAGTFLMFTPSAFAMNYIPDVTVCLNGCDETTIQAGIDAATNGQAILVMPGVYNESIILGDGKILFSMGTTFTTTIDAAGLESRTATIQSGSTLDGFVITGGSIIGDGGGVSAGIGSTITNNRITGNYASVNGGGLSGVGSIVTQNVISGNNADGKGGGAVLFGSTIFSKNTVENNTAYDGGGILLRRGGAVVSKSIIKANTATRYGGGVYFGSRYSYNKVINSLIIGNTASSGGGVQFSGYSYAKIFHSTISGNTASYDGGGIGPGGNSRGIISNVISWGNNGDNLGSTRYGSPLITYSLIDQDPLFKDAANGDYRLEFGSAAIDTGSNSGESGEDINGTLRSQDGDGAGSGTTGDGSDYDIGAYEVVLEMCTS